MLNEERERLKQELKDARILIAVLLYSRGGEVYIDEKVLWEVAKDADNFELVRWTDGYGRDHLKVQRKEKNLERE